MTSLGGNKVMILRPLITAIATLGVGKIPKAPGTWGAFLAMLVWWALMPPTVWIQWGAITFAFVLGVWATSWYERLNHQHDPKEVVVDELVGMWITATAVPESFVALLIAFLLFRFFDIWKPFPVGWIDQNVPGAIGTVLDDVVAGVMAMLIFHLGVMAYTYWL